MSTPPNDPHRTDVSPAPRQPGEPAVQGRSVDELSFLLSTRRTHLSFQRTRMSSDRTLMSIIRTALSLIGFGFTTFQFFRYLRQSAGPASAISVEAARNFSVGLMLLGIALLVLGIVGDVRFMLDLRHEREQLVRDGLLPADRFPYSVTLAIAVLLGLLGVLAVVSTVASAGPFH